jgi:hypothetical protein
MFFVTIRNSVVGRSVLLSALLFVCAVQIAHCQSDGEARWIAKDFVLLRNNPSTGAEVETEMDRGTKVKHLDKEGGWCNIVQPFVRYKGWVQCESLVETESLAKKSEEENQTVKSSRFIQNLAEKGCSIMLTRQTFLRNRNGIVSLGLGVINISEAKTIKYVHVDWELFNRVGDPVSNTSTKRTRLVGPLEPGQTSFIEWEGVWKSSVGSCAVVTKIKVTHIDGSTFTYLKDLKEIPEKAESVNVAGDCSYENQEGNS